MLKLIASLIGFFHYMFPCEASLKEPQAMSDHIPIVEGTLVIVMLEALIPQFFGFCMGLPE